MANCEEIVPFIERLVERLVQQEAAVHTPSSVETSEAFIVRRKTALTQAITNTLKKALSGYRILHERLEQGQSQDMQRYQLNVTQLNELPLNEPVILYKVFGWNEEALNAFYQEANELCTQERYPEAVDAFTFLCVITPLSADVWQGLATCYAACKNEPEAEEAGQLVRFLHTAAMG